MNKHLYTIALVGNPNAGKTALINVLAGAHLAVGNWPGVTVEKKEAYCLFNQNQGRLIDLPGMYSLDPKSQEETIAKEFIDHEKIDLLINVVDATSLGRGLFLTTQLLALGKPMILVLNMWDDFTKNGTSIDLVELENRLGIPVLPTNAKKAHGIDLLKEKIIEVLTHGENFICKKTSDFLSQNAQEQYAKVDATLEGIYKKPKQPRKRISEFLDSIFLHRLLGIPAFFVILYGVFKVTFDGSKPFISWVSTSIELIVQYCFYYLEKTPMPLWMQSLLVDGLLRGVGLVLTFLPLLSIFYFFFALLEESGYMARAAFVIDRVMRSFGLQGKAFIALLVGFGCNVPAVYATRTLQNQNDRKLTSFLLSFMSCGAKLPIYAFFVFIFFPQHQAIIILCLYVLGIVVAGIWGVILHRTVFRGELSLFVLELPPYRLPTQRMLFLSVWSKIRTYLSEAGVLVAATMVILWALLNLPYDVPPEKTFLGMTAKTVAPLFQPLGFGNNWESVAAILPGFVAKEVVIGALGQMYAPEQQADIESLPPVRESLVTLGVGFIEATKSAVLGIVDSFIPSTFRIEEPDTQDTPFYDAIRRAFTPLSALSFMVFNLLLVSCIATMGAIIQEFGRKHLVFVVLLTLSTAYFVSWLVFTIGSFFIT